ncbi:hypothetical protein [Bordetella bronchialis]|uniref:Uncharacterized protein n=1 Tax=Bordetella bronchialis TaxID=463025 RepID=A0A193G1D3_9BORD|nr:hypothetical protein [Bordetella bronchialis]ANN68672.1 hypothetical protein BAU06_22310 [Bordetella bronchialis]ANN73812.1 hypothetical protein BAU08_22840 [Bordetella bronchialis]
MSNVQNAYSPPVAYGSLQPSPHRRRDGDAKQAGPSWHPPLTRAADRMADLLASVGGDADADTSGVLPQAAWDTPLTAEEFRAGRFD